MLSDRFDVSGNSVFSRSSLLLLKTSQSPLALFLCILFLLNSCGKNSSPEGRMSTRMNDVEKTLMEKMDQQHDAVMDSIAKMREEINLLKRGK